jgi:hypothetical protein
MYLEAIGWEGSIWIYLSKVGTNGRLLSRQKRTFEPDSMREIYVLAKVLLDFIEGFFRMEF